MLVDGEPVSASLFDFGLAFFHNARELLERGSGPYFYLPKLESHLEARLWNDVFVLAQDALGIAAGHDPRDRPDRDDPRRVRDGRDPLRAARPLRRAERRPLGLHLQRDQEVPRSRPEFVLPDRAQVTMTVPFMRAYTSCSSRPATGAARTRSAAWPRSSRRGSDPEVNEVALAKVREDKEREAGDGFDGTWVAHPDLVPVATEIFDGVLGERPNQVERLRDDVAGRRADLLVRPEITPAARSPTTGVAANVASAIRYLDSWLRGSGAAAIDNLMEDVATAEISRSQLWQWVRHGTSTRASAGGDRRGARRQELQQSSSTEVALADEFVEFLTLPAYEHSSWIDVDGWPRALHRLPRPAAPVWTGRPVVAEADVREVLRGAGLGRHERRPGRAGDPRPQRAT